jgi:hypothetical protein
VLSVPSVPNGLARLEAIYNHFQLALTSEENNDP